MADHCSIGQIICMSKMWVWDSVMCQYSTRWEFKTGFCEGYRLKTWARDVSRNHTITSNKFKHDPRRVVSVSSRSVQLIPHRGRWHLPGLRWHLPGLTYVWIIYPAIVWPMDSQWPTTGWSENQFIAKESSLKSTPFHIKLDSKEWFQSLVTSPESDMTALIGSW